MSTEYKPSVTAQALGLQTKMLMAPIPIGAAYDPEEPEPVEQNLAELAIVVPPGETIGFRYELSLCLDNSTVYIGFAETSPPLSVHSAWVDLDGETGMSAINGDGPFGPVHQVVLQMVGKAVNDGEEPQTLLPVLTVSETSLPGADFIADSSQVIYASITLG